MLRCVKRFSVPTDTTMPNLLVLLFDFQILERGRKLMGLGEKRGNNTHKQYWVIFFKFFKKSEGIIRV